MPNVGDWITPRLTIDTAAGDTVASLFIFKPDGTSVAGTSETGTSGNTVWTADQVQLTAADVWVLTWTVTGTGKSVESEYVIAEPTAAALDLPTALATVANLVAVLGRQLTAAELARAPGLLASASTRIRGYCKRNFLTTLNATTTLRPIGSELHLRQTPVVAVDQVEMIGAAGTANRIMGVTEWAFDGIDRIELWPDPVALNAIAPTGTYADVYRVTYDYGAATAPELIVDLATELVLDVLLSPSLTAGLIGEKIGQYSYQVQQGGDSPGTTGASVRALSKPQKQMLIDAGFRHTAGTIQTRVG